MSALVVAAAVVVLVSSMGASLAGSMVRYGPGEECSGYLAKPAGDGPFPAMVVVHEWWGLNDNIKHEADKLAQAGYVALAVDLFGKTTTDPEQAMAMVRGFDQKAAAPHLAATVGYLGSLPYVRADKIGSIGWCFGGGVSLGLAIADARLAAAVVYYGQPVTVPAELAKIEAPILLIYGEADQMIPIEKARELDADLTKAGVRHEFHSYPGAPHAFANPSGGHNYKPEAAADAWKRTMAFLDAHLKERS